MARALRSEQFPVSEISTVHVMQRCVRRAYLTGVDPNSGVDYEHRREWIRRRIEALASVYGIDVLSYAILSNHIHLILRNRPDVVSAWSDREVAVRWLRVFPGRRLEEHLGEPTESDVEALALDAQRLSKVRSRLANISWFMRSLCEPIARMANKQDDCTGRFWESRFKAQPIVDEAGLIACSIYVDLNPLRASLAETIETSVHTSAYDRIQARKGEMIRSVAFELGATPNNDAAMKIQSTSPNELRKKQPANRGQRKIRRDAWLSPLKMRTLSNDPEIHRDGLRASDKGFTDMRLKDYLRLLTWSSGTDAKGSRQKPPPTIRAMLEKAGINPTMWRDLIHRFRYYFGRSGCIGTHEGMRSRAIKNGRKWTRGDRHVSPCFG